MTPTTKAIDAHFEEYLRDVPTANLGTRESHHHMFMTAFLCGISVSCQNARRRSSCPQWKGSRVRVPLECLQRSYARTIWNMYSRGVPLETIRVHFLYHRGVNIPIEEIGDIIDQIMEISEIT